MFDFNFVNITAEQVKTGRSLSEALDLAEAQRTWLSDEWIYPFENIKDTDLVPRMLQEIKKYHKTVQVIESKKDNRKNKFSLCWLATQGAYRVRKARFFFRVSPWSCRL